MSRRIRVELYERIVALRPASHHPDPSRGSIKVVMTGSAADPSAFQPHLHNKQTLRAIKARAKDPADPLQVVIVRDMWLTGFDSPALHTIYVDKPMQGAGLMQVVSEAVSADELIDVHAAAGMEQPDLSIISDEFLEGLAHAERPNLQMAVLRRLLDDRIRTLRRANVVQSRLFSTLLDDAINRYTNRALTTAEIIAELVKLAKQVRDQAGRGAH